MSTATIITGTMVTIFGAAMFGNNLLLPIATLAVFCGVVVAMCIRISWKAVRHAPTLRSRRFQLYSIFWLVQYVPLFLILNFGVLGAIGEQFFPKEANQMAHFAFSMVFFSVLPALIVPAVSVHWVRRLQGMIHGDLGLPGKHVESYSYPQVERRFFLSLFTCLLLMAMAHVAFVGQVLIFSRDVSDLSFLFLARMVAGLAAIALVTALYYFFGRSLLETCRTKQNFLTTPPVIDNPFDIILKKTGGADGSKQDGTESDEATHLQNLREAIARFDPVTMTADEPEVAARPFPKSWFWLGGIYAVTVLTLFCLVVMSPVATPRAMLLQTGIIHDHTIPGDFVPWNAHRYYRRGMRASHLDDPQQAIEEYTIAIRLNPRFTAAYSARSSCWLSLPGGKEDQANVDNALADLAEAIRLDHPRKQYYIFRAMLYDELGEPEKAAADREKAKW